MLTSLGLSWAGEVSRPGVLCCGVSELLWAPRWQASRWSWLGVLFPEAPAGSMHRAGVRAPVHGASCCHRRCPVSHGEVAAGSGLCHRLRARGCRAGGPTSPRGGGEPGSSACPLRFRGPGGGLGGRNRVKDTDEGGVQGSSSADKNSAEKEMRKVQVRESLHTLAFQRQAEANTVEVKLGTKGRPGAEEPAPRPLGGVGRCVPRAGVRHTRGAGAHRPPLPESEGQCESELGLSWDQIHSTFCFMSVFW